jgi:NADP-dependent 3-hydroxy acid dehydrogenase YdfG
LGYYSARVAVVTGAGSGIGRALAMALGKRGAHLALADRDGDAVADTARRCQGGSVRVRADTVDVTDRQALLDYPAVVLGDFGRVDLVFCAAGVIHTGSLLACRLTCAFAPCLDRQFSGGGFPHVVAGGGVAVL